MKYPILITSQLTLRQLSVDDQLDIFALRSDDIVNQYLDRTPSKSIDDAIRFINMMNENIEKGDAYYWAITLTASKKMVGTVCLFDFSAENESCEIGYELMPAFQGKGIMKEAVGAVINFVFQRLKLKKIFAYTHCDNLASTHLLTQFNFEKSPEPFSENDQVIIYTLTQSYVS